MCCSSLADFARSLLSEICGVLFSSTLKIPGLIGLMVIQKDVCGGLGCLVVKTGFLRSICYSAVQSNQHRHTGLN